MQNEQWIADRALLRRLWQAHPEWTQPQLAAAVGRWLGFVKKWLPRCASSACGRPQRLVWLALPTQDPLSANRSPSRRTHPGHSR